MGRPIHQNEILQVNEEDVDDPQPDDGVPEDLVPHLDAAKQRGIEKRLHFMEHVLPHDFN